MLYTLPRNLPKKLVYFLAVSALTTFSLSCSTPQRSACKNTVRFQGRGFDFSKNEEVLLCGDEKSDGWKNIPPAQREFMLRNYLRGRGFHRSDIRFQEDVLLVDPGVKSRISEVQFEGTPDGFFDIGFVGWKSEIIESNSLDKIEAWVLKRLHAIGYPCATLKTVANTDTSIVKVVVSPGEKKFFPAPSYDAGKSLDVPVMRRYDAFQEGDVYDERLLDLTSSRMGNDGVVLKSYFVPECKTEPFQVTHQVSLGEPRLLRLGVGASTEELIFSRASWRTTRLGTNASNLFVDLYGSRLRQSVELGMDWYALGKHQRWRVQPTLSAERVNEERNANLRLSAAPLIAHRGDFGLYSLDTKFGPSINFERTFDGPVVGGKTFYLLETEAIFSSHLFQIYSSAPREGFQLSGSTQTLFNRYTTGGAHRLRLEGVKLINLADNDPPQWILGFRGGLSTVVFNSSASTKENLPSDFRTFLGGADNVRGFGRRELPFGTGVTHLSAYLGTELRVPAILPENFDPLIFFDIGRIGDQNFDFYGNTYLSPGLGLRFQSPIGAVRFTVARGFILGSVDESIQKEHFQFFISLGREF